MTDEFGSPQRSDAPRRRRWVIPIIVIVGILALLVAAVVVAEPIARATVVSRTQQLVADGLGHPSPDEVAVDIGAAPVLPQLVAGRLDQLSVEIPRLSYGTLSGSATATASGVALRGQPTAERLDVTITLGEDDVAALADEYLSMLPDLDARFDAPEIVVSSEFEVLSFSIPVGIAFVPSTERTAIVLTPSAIVLSGRPVSINELAGSLVGFLSDLVTDATTIELAEVLPSGLEVRTAVVEGETLLVRLGGSGVSLEAPPASP